MGEIRTDTNAPVFDSPFGQGWIIKYEDRADSPKPTTSSQPTGQMPVHLRDMSPYITPEEMRAREWSEKLMPDISYIQTWSQLRPKASLTINQWK